MISNNRTAKRGFKVLILFVNYSVYFNSLFSAMVAESTLLLLFNGSLIKQNTADISSTNLAINRALGVILFIIY